jgi:hypothetical protein
MVGGKEFWVWPRLPEAGRQKKRSATLSTSRDTKNSQARVVFKGLRVAHDGSSKYDIM